MSRLLIGSAPRAERPPHPGMHHPRQLVDELLEMCILLQEDWDKLPPTLQDAVRRAGAPQASLALLVEHGLLTEYQAARVGAGTIHGLVLGNYRVLERIGAGGMAVVFKGEHIDMRHPVALKVLPLGGDHDAALMNRFLAEIRTVARLRHPNIVTATDAARVFSPDPDHPMLWYLVMEYVAGKDLEDYVHHNGPLPVTRACNLMHQIASALAETHKFQLVHRDIKPSNILLAGEDQAKLLDFGLSRQFDTRLTEPGAILGTIDYMAPEQAEDASQVDIRADLYGLGGTLFWCLTGRLPFPPEGTMIECLMRRLTQPPPSVRQFAPDVPPALDAVVARLLATKPEDRYPDPTAVMRALLPFLRPERGFHELQGLDDLDTPELAAPAILDHCTSRLLIVDDEPGMRQFCRSILQGENVWCDTAASGEEALTKLDASQYDLALLDVNLPGISGPEVLRRLRAAPPSPHLKIIMFSGGTPSDDMAEMLLAGADDYLTKPFSVVQLSSRVKAALRLKAAQDRSVLLNRHLFAINSELERNLTSRDSDLIGVRNTLVLALSRLVEQRDTESQAHLLRMQRYARCLAEAAASSPVFADQIDAHFIELLEGCVPLHDIGKVGLPDHILMKPGKLTPDERILCRRIPPSAPRRSRKWPSSRAALWPSCTWPSTSSATTTSASTGTATPIGSSAPRSRCRPAS
jgi:serine/threonine protein kinase